MSDLFWCLWFIVLYIGMGLLGFYIGKVVFSQRPQPALDFESCLHCGLLRDPKGGGKWGIKFDDKLEMVIHWRCLIKLIEDASKKEKL